MSENIHPSTEKNDSLDSLDWAVLEEKYPVTVREKLASLPDSPGCYLMKNSSGVIIYVGKAKILKNRVRSYFQKGADLTRHKRQMVREIMEIETIATDSELEALILESNLIKKHQPHYNVRLRDDKSYPYIAVTLSDEWPRVVFMRKLRMKPKEKDKYYGPYTDTEAVRDTLKLIRRVFKVPCGYKNPNQSKGKACMYYHINQCTGVCAGKITHDEYMSVIKDVMSFLEGRREELVDRLLAEMQRASDSLNFEKAAKLRDEVSAIQKLIARQKVISSNLDDQDVIALVTDNGNTCAEMFFIRGGKLIGQEHFLLENASSDEISEGLSGFIKQYYENAPYIPREVLLSADIEEMDIIERWMHQKRGMKVNIASPKRGEKKELVEMAKKNAKLVLKQLKLKMAKDESRINEELDSLQKAVNSPALPHRIEAYDISNIQGHHTVASLVVFEDGQPKKEHYRRFKIKEHDGKPDDFASMKEVITRRLAGTLRRTAAFQELPDLILVDGGKGQLSSAVEVLEEIHEDVPMIGLAKQFEEIYKPGISEPVILPRSSKALQLLQRIRDEAHRFAITYHRNLRDKAMKASVLNKISGIGTKRKKALISYFGSVEKIKSATLDDLIKAPTMNKNAAAAVYSYFSSEEHIKDTENKANIVEN